MTVEIRRLGREEAEALIGEIARLRIEVFRDFPYLYDGDRDYEARYLAKYLESPGAVLIGAFAEGSMVGAATAAPLTDHFEAFERPFRERGFDPAEFLYFGESVLERRWRGRGIGVAFFREREAAACAAGYAATVFSAVLRPPDHPSRPAGHVELDGFWRNRGYRRVDGLLTHFSWKDVGDEVETEKPMEFWMKRLDAAGAGTTGDAMNRG